MGVKFVTVDSYCVFFNIVSGVLVQAITFCFVYKIIYLNIVSHPEWVLRMDERMNE